MVGKCVILILILVAEASSSNLTFLKNYDAKTCKNEPSCNLVDDPAIPADRRTLRKRPCMCDADCVIYRDCCTDSKYYNELEQSRPPPFYCELAQKVYLKTTCPETWTDEAVRSKCNVSTSPLRSDDTSLIIPVTNTIKNITYGNKYCALCHGETNLISWNLSPLCGEAPAGLLHQQSTLLPDLTVSTTILPIPPSTPAVLPITTGLTTRFPRLTPASKEYSVSGPTSKVQFRRSRSSELDSSRQMSRSQYENPSSKYERRKRAAKIRVNFLKYYKYLDVIWKTAKYDPHSTYFVSKFQDKDMICSVSTKLPSELKPHTRACVPNTIEICQVATDAETDRQCRSHTSLIFNKRNNKAYRNKYCATCDGAETTYLTGCPITVKDETVVTIYL